MKYGNVPATWTQANDLFQVSDKGAVRPDRDFHGFPGKLAACVPIDTAEFILNNIDSFKQAIALAKGKRDVLDLSKETKTLVAEMIKLGVPEAVALEQAVAVIKLRQKAA